MQSDLREFARTWWISGLLLGLSTYILVRYGTYTLFDWAALIIHEPGHLFFRPFGRFIGLAGGTLMQILIPSALAWSFLRNGYRTGFQVMTFWLGHNFVNISVYAGDARRRVLPLITGDVNTHDWWQMLGRLGLLEYDQWFRWGFIGLAVVAFLVAVVAPRWVGE